MKHCSIVICSALATWEGVLAVINTEFVEDVAYCDRHAQFQLSHIPDGLRLELTPIGQH